MSVLLQLIGAPTTTLASYLGAAKELAVDTTAWRLYLYDGVTPGGYPVAKYYELPSSTNILPIASGGTGAGTIAGVLSNFFNWTGTTITAPTNTQVLFAQNNQNLLVVDSYVSSAASSQLVLRSARGSASSPSAVQSGDALGSYTVRGYGTTGFSSARATLNFTASQAWTDTAQGCYASLLATATGTTTIAEGFRVHGDGYNVTFFATADQSKSVQVPTTGFSITLGNKSSMLVLRPAGTLASGTITMPAAPADGQIVHVASSQTVTALTVAANTGQTITGAPTTIAPTTPFAFIYDLSTTSWTRFA